MESIQNCILQSEWLSFIGNVIGALIGGLIAYIIARSQVKQMKRQSRIEEINNFLKFHQMLSVLLGKIFYLLDGENKEQEYLNLNKLGLDECMRRYLDNRIESDFKSSKLYLDKIIKIRDELSEIYNQIESLKDSYILYEFYDKYLDLLLTLNIQINFVDTFLYHSYPELSDEVATTLDEPLNDHDGVGKTVQSRIISVENTEYRNIYRKFRKYQSDLDNIYYEKNEEKDKLKKRVIF